MMKNILLLVSFLSLSAHASIVGVVDSGFYMEHELLKDQVWTNTAETKNRIDDDKNGYVDDIHGWNFAENSKFLFDATQVAGIKPISYKIISIASKLMAGTATDEEKAFVKENLIDLPKKEQAVLMEEINFYGQHAHGTHVAGIVAKENPNAELMNLRFFPSSVSPYNYVPMSGFWGKVEDTLFGVLADLTGSVFNQAVSYVGSAGADVVNMSLGIPMERFAGFVLGIKGNKEPTEDELAVESQKIYQKFEANAKEWANVAPNTLFVVAAGNSAINNDKIPAFPANVDIPNLISVAATIGVSKFPEIFSNYGKATVDIAAPGVDIKSSAPGPTIDFEIEMTGTSMAAPMVAGVASAVKDANPSLNAVEIKRVLMETVDKKSWLTDRVVSGGVLNNRRAVEAATLSNSRSLDIAIAESLITVSDQVETRDIPAGRQTLDDQTISVLKNLVF
jgi:subtilisin family serine protease